MKLFDYKNVKRNLESHFFQIVTPVYLKKESIEMEEEDIYQIQERRTKTMNKGGRENLFVPYFSSIVN